MGVQFLNTSLLVLLTLGLALLARAWWRSKRKAEIIQVRLRETGLGRNLYAAVFDALEQGVAIVDLAGRVLEVNQTLKNSAPNWNTWGSFLDAFAEVDRGEIRSTFETAVKSLSTQRVHGVYWNISSDSPLLVDLTFSPVVVGSESPTRVVLVIEFPSPLVKSLEFQEESLDRLQSLLTAIPDVLFTTDPRGRVEYWNESAEKLTGYSFFEMKGRPWQSFLQLEESSKSAACAASGEMPEMINQECTIVTREGRQITVLVSTGVLKGPTGETLGNITVLKDITPIKELEEKLKQQQDKLQRANSELEQLARHRSRFLSHVSHELRTPLNSILGFTSILLEEIIGPLNEEQRKQLELVYRQSQRLLEQINELLDAARLEARRITLNPKPFPIEGAIVSVLEALQPLARQKNLNLYFQKPDTLLPLVYADPKRVEQILVNLVNNAIKYTNAGEVRLECEVCKDCPTMVEVRVRDTGIGIAAEELERLFQEFWQSQSPQAQGKGGLGLGLTIAKQLVEMQGGTIGVDSRPGQGTTFLFTLPLYSQDGRLVSVLESTAAQSCAVAIVTEDPVVARALKTFLMDQGVPAVWWQSRGEMAEQVLSNSPDQLRGPSVWIVDEPLWNDVQEVLRVRNAESAWGPVHCIILSLDREETVSNESKRIFCRKPLSGQRLLGLLRDLLSSR